ncbi:hypothetical protein R7D64_06035 [Vibrio sp. Vb2535]|uniref:hypothetical protein n=1 Tax=Vibrio TaxID=662 RepID=UPI002964AB74|nr:hypothetical protein [Vibrio sp. Vb2535]EKK7180253.1 hypothetical protein [Vibrio alginolyticus]MDW1752456.1 hypothetical protein [Vibrio sp. Vb2535]
MKTIYVVLFLAVSFSSSAASYLCQANVTAYISNDDRYEEMRYLDKSPKNQWVVNAKKGWYEIKEPISAEPWGKCIAEQVMDTKQLVCTQGNLSTFAINLNSLSFTYIDIFLGNTAVSPSVTSFTGICQPIK